MARQAFTRNHSDHSNDTGFQFESREASVSPACGKCQATLAGGAKFCAQCGTPSAPTPALAGPKFCAHCGGSIEPGARFCPGCGGKLT